ncbi:MAG TPA: prepilin-type N-terminal cleavage/methylation domain-containing protein [Candidatus Saccharibacteria bacterium]|nr:prepilin-type N-terminal cleavage/methylation domain-containing protein [Candidatus Saccharibacteria bacterium]
MIKIKKNIKTKFYDGFTIIELLITIVIIGILIAITFVSYNDITQKSKIVLLQSDLKRASDILEMDEFSSSNRKYPATKELANSGNGLIPSQDVVFNYTNISEVNFYCLTATHNDSLSYYISSLISTSILGKCNDSYILGWGELEVIMANQSYILPMVAML